MTRKRPTPKPAPNAPQLAKELGLTEDEYLRVVDILGREPSVAELGTFSVMWSEHCSYKSSKVYLRTLPTTGERILVGPGENAGVVDVGNGQAVTFKIESHNHPSFVEPFQGATTGVGGIIRDILTMGARPIAIMDPLRFGDPSLAKTRWIVDGVVQGIGHYGNCLGVATVGGETVFDPCYNGNPLVNALCVGVLPKDRIQLAVAERPGDIAVLIGQRTGRDGIGGASVLASASFGAQAAEGGSAIEADEAKRPNVQVGDPFAGKLLIESCLQLYAEELLSGIQDMGAAGIACSTSEMAAKAGLGMLVDLDKVPLRERSMEAWEILCSESQERMLALVSPDKLARVLEVCAHWGIDATPIGEVIEGDRLVFTYRGEVVHDAPAGALADEGPTYHRPVEDWVHPHVEEDVDGLPAPADLAEAVRTVLGSPNVGSARWVYEQYDSIVQHGTVQGPGADAAVLRLPPIDDDDAEYPRGIALATDGNGRWCALDPEEGAKLVVAEAARNVACTGAMPVAATNCLNFGSPERPEVMGQFRDTVRGLGEACEVLGVPITGGNVSFYNQTGETAIHPTPVVGVLGVFEQVVTHVPNAFREAGDVIFLVGTPTRPGLGGSEYLWRVHGRIAGRPPRIDLEEERRLHSLLWSGAEAQWLRSAHDVSLGGLVTTVIESCLPNALGARLVPEPKVEPVQFLFSESPSRVIASVRAPDAEQFVRLCEARGVWAHKLGVVLDEPVLHVQDLLDLDLAEARRLVDGAIPEALNLS